VVTGRTVRERGSDFVTLRPFTVAEADTLKGVVTSGWLLGAETVRIAICPTASCGGFKAPDTPLGSPDTLREASCAKPVVLSILMV
jgi:hypothetical protein